MDSKQSELRECQASIGKETKAPAQAEAYQGRGSTYPSQKVRVGREWTLSTTATEACW